MPMTELGQAEPRRQSWSVGLVSTQAANRMTALSPAKADRNCDNQGARGRSRQFWTAVAIDRKTKRICQEHRQQRRRTQSCQYNHPTGLKDSPRILVAIWSMEKKLERRDSRCTYPVRRFLRRFGRSFQESGGKRALLVTLLSRLRM